MRVLEMNGETAKVESNYWIAEAETVPALVATGYYIDVVKKVNGVWKLAHRKQMVDESFKMK